MTAEASQGVFISRKFAGLVLGVCAAATASAQTHVSPVSFSVGNWNVKPVYRADSGTPRVEALVCLARPDTTTGDNLVAVMYQRGAVDTMPWSAKTWETTDLAEAVKSAKAALGIGDEDDALWRIGDGVDISGWASAVEKGYTKGFVEGGPFAALAENSDRDNIVVALAEWGMRVADLPFDKDSDCPCLDTDKELWVYCRAVEASLGGDIDSAQMRFSGAIDDGLETLCAFLSPNIVERTWCQARLVNDLTLTTFMCTPWNNPRTYPKPWSAPVPDELELRFPPVGRPPVVKCAYTRDICRPCYETTYFLGVRVNTRVYNECYTQRCVMDRPAGATSCPTIPSDEACPFPSDADPRTLPYPAPTTTTPE